MQLPLTRGPVGRKVSWKALRMLGIPAPLAPVLSTLPEREPDDGDTENNNEDDLDSDLCNHPGQRYVREEVQDSEDDHERQRPVGNAGNFPSGRLLRRGRIGPLWFLRRSWHERTEPPVGASGKVAAGMLLRRV